MINEYTLGNTYCVCGKKPCICLPYTIFKNEKPYAQISNETKGKHIAAALTLFEKKGSLEGKAKSDENFSARKEGDYAVLTGGIE